MSFYGYVFVIYQVWLSLVRCVIPAEVVQSLKTMVLELRLLLLTSWGMCKLTVMNYDRKKICCKLSTDQLEVGCQNLSSTGLLRVVSTSCNKSANGKLQQA